MNYVFLGLTPQTSTLHVNARCTPLTMTVQKESAALFTTQSLRYIGNPLLIVSYRGWGMVYTVFLRYRKRRRRSLQIIAAALNSGVSSVLVLYVALFAHCTTDKANSSIREYLCGGMEILTKPPF